MSTKPPVAPLTDADIDLHAEELLGFEETNGGRVWYVDGATVAKADLRAFVRSFVGRARLSEARPAPDRDPRMESASWLLENRWITYADYEKARAALSGHST